jgi:hypothetical protein
MTTTAVADRQSLAHDFNEAYEQGEHFGKQSIESFAKAGGILNEAKKRLPHGQWLLFVHNDLRCGKTPLARERKAQRLMAVANAKSDVNVGFEELCRIMWGNKGRKRRVHPTDNQYVAERMAKKLLRSVITKWHHEIAQQFHPDKGGNPEVMAAINHAVDRLKNMVADLWR